MFFAKKDCRLSLTIQFLRRTLATPCRGPNPPAAAVVCSPNARLRESSRYDRNAHVGTAALRQAQGRLSAVHRAKRGPPANLVTELGRLIEDGSNTDPSKNDSYPGMPLAMPPCPKMKRAFNRRAATGYASMSRSPHRKSRMTMTVTTPAQLGTDQIVLRKTNKHVGRRILVNPANSAMQHLAYGRIILNTAKREESFSSEDRETGLICLSGQATVVVENSKVKNSELKSSETILEPYDAIYIPRDSAVQVSTSSHADLAEFSADVVASYPLQVVRYAEVSKDPGLKFTTGGSSCTRHINMLLAKNIEAGRLIVGFTDSEPGNWTSWPPHEHAAMLEEIYVYFNMPDPAYGIQLVYTNAEVPELVTVVRDGDAVLLPSGFHPNVSVPGHRICFLWAMAAHREIEDRQYGVVNVQRGFDQGPTGLEAGRKK